MPNPALLSRFEPHSNGTPLEHERQLWQARYSPCGNFLIAGGYDGAVQRWNTAAEKPEKLTPLTGHHGWVQCQGFSPDGEQLLTADSWGRLTCWRYRDANGPTIWSHEAAHDGWIRALAVSPDGERLATGGNDRRLKIWCTKDGSLVKDLEHPEKILSLAFHPTGDQLVSGDLTGRIRGWSLDTFRSLNELDARTLYQRDHQQECGGVRQLSFSADGNQLAGAGQKTPGGGFAVGTPCALVFDWNSGKLLREMPVGSKEDGFAFDVQFHPAGFVMGASCAFPGRGHLWFWNPADEQPFYVSNAIPNGRSVSLHPGGTHLALLISVSANGNGRQLVNGAYDGGKSKIEFLQFPGSVE